MATRRQILWIGTTHPSLKAFSTRMRAIKSSALLKPVKSEPPIIVVNENEPEDTLLALKKKWPRYRGRLIVLSYNQNDEPELAEKYVELMNHHPIDGFYQIPSDVKRLTLILQSEIKKANKPEPQLPLTGEASDQDSDSSTDLAQMIQARTETSKTEIESKVSKVRGLIRFLKELSTVQSVDELMNLLRLEMRVFPQVKTPLLASLTLQNTLRIHYFQGSQLLSKSSDQIWPQSSMIRSNDKKDSLYLANLFGRPFAKLVAVPLKVGSITAMLYFEHAFGEKDLSEFLKFLEARLQPVSIALDRLFLEGDLKDASLLWERTFDSLQDPIAIFDNEGDMLRANRAFAEKLEGIDDAQLSDSKIIFNNRVFEKKAYPIALVKGEEPTNVVNHYVDVTLSHALQRQMIQNEKMAALGHLAGNIAHELNNPLTGVRSLAQILVTQVEPETNQSKDLIEVEKAAERCQSIIRNLLDFSSGGLHNKESISLNEIIKRTLPLLKTAMGRFRHDVVYDDHNLDVFVEPQLMQQVVFNLIKNACQAMSDDKLDGRWEEKGEIIIETHKVGKWAELTVSDTGTGIPSEIRDKIFDFFFTTKNPGQGTGLGLSMSKNIIDEFGGTISVESEVGKGSTFKVRLPIAAGPV